MIYKQIVIFFSQSSGLFFFVLAARNKLLKKKETDVGMYYPDYEEKASSLNDYSK